MPPVTQTQPLANKKQVVARSDDVQPTTARHLVRLATLHVLWKLLLLAVVALSPGPGYDTSTLIALGSEGHSSDLVSRLTTRLTRWDGIYFASLSADGYTFEQQWAFSWAFTRISSLVADDLPFTSSLPLVAKHALAGVLISCISHLIAALILYLLIDSLLPSHIVRRKEIAFTAACLHILSPAGIFLAAPYAEALYAHLSMVGTLTYVFAIESRARGVWYQDVSLTVLTGLAWGLACMMRGNGLLNGIIFAWDLGDMTFAFLLGDRTISQLGRMCATIVAGVCVAAGWSLPQFVAYREYCLPVSSRAWCDNIVPSIYGWVQEQYWDVGFLRYWKPSNIPLFLLAAPMVLLLLATGYSTLHHSRSILLAINGEEPPSLRNDQAYLTKKLIYQHVLERLALPQLVLAVMAVTSFHVQIVNRISSGYPLWYMVLAVAIHDQSPQLDCGHTRAEHYFPFRHIGGKRLKWIVQAFAVYALVQAGLYASFLPPA